MKGLLFTEFLEMVEEDFDCPAANAIVLQAHPSSRGNYTSARGYHHHEMAALFRQLHHRTRTPFGQLAAAFGRRLCKRILLTHPRHKACVSRVFFLLSKRSPAPVFEYLQSGTSRQAVLYNPQAKAACLAGGMVKGCLEHLLNQSRVEESVLHKGRRKFLITLN